MATLQYVLPMASTTHLTTKCSSPTSMEYTLKSPGVFTFVPRPQQPVPHDFDSALAVSWLERRHGLPVDQLFGSFNDVRLEPRVARAGFPR